MNRRTLTAATAALAVVATALTLAACSSDAGGDATSSGGATPSGTSDGVSADLGSLTVGLTYVPDIQFAPFYVADALGYYDEAGLEVTLRHHGANEGLFTALDQGAEDVVVASGDEVLTQCASGGDITQLATLYATSPVALLAPADAGITAPADLAGLTIGVPGEYGSTYLGLLQLLAEGGLTPADVTIQSIGYTQTTALLTHQVDAVMGFLNGDAVRIAAAGTQVSTLEPSDLVSVGIAAPHAFAGTPEAEAFVAATLRGVTEVIADPEGAVAIAADYIPGMTAQAKADALAVLEATVPLLSETGETDVATWDAMAAAMVGAGLISSAGIDAGGCEPSN